jgi:hypothetical protein
MKIVEGIASVWHYHLSETGKNGKPALCGNKNVMQTIKNPSEEMMLKAVKQNGDVIEFIKNPTEKILRYLLDVEIDTKQGTCTVIKP